MLFLLAQVVLIPPPSPCNVAGGTPSVVAYESRAVAGDEWVCTWTMRPPAAPWNYPNSPSYLVIGLNPVAPVQIPGGGGCWLMARADAWVNVAASSTVTQNQGVVRTRVTFPASTIGWTFYMQLLATDPRTSAGVVTSPLMQVSPENNT